MKRGGTGSDRMLEDRRPHVRATFPVELVRELDLGMVRSEVLGGELREVLDHHDGLLREVADGIEIGGTRRNVAGAVLSERLFADCAVDGVFLVAFGPVEGVCEREMREADAGIGERTGRGDHGDRGHVHVTRDMCERRFRERAFQGTMGLHQSLLCG